jgi:glycosyltransferase involved in cell wall biosynthesis
MSLLVAESAAWNSPAPRTAAAGVAVITRTKERPLFLERAIRSVLAQTFADWMHVIVNDGGDRDAVDRVVAAFAGPYRDRVLVIHNPVSVGMEAATNIGVRASQSRFLAVHDDDDSWSPRFLETVTEAIAAARASIGSVRGAISHAMVIRETAENGVIRTGAPEPFNAWIEDPILPLDRLILANMFPPISLVFERAAADEIGLFDETLPVLGDWDFNVRFCTRYDIAVVREPLAFWHHRRTAEGASGNSIFVSADAHKTYRTVLKNRWLRADLQHGGVGMLLRQMESFDNVARALRASPSVASSAANPPQSLYPMPKGATARGLRRLVSGDRRGHSYASLLEACRRQGWRGLKQALREIGA